MFFEMSKLSDKIENNNLIQTEQIDKSDMPDENLFDNVDSTILSSDEERRNRIKEYAFIPVFIGLILLISGLMIYIFYRSLKFLFAWQFAEIEINNILLVFLFMLDKFLINAIRAKKIPAISFDSCLKAYGKSMYYIVILCSCSALFFILFMLFMTFFT